MANKLPLRLQRIELDEQGPRALIPKLEAILRVREAAAKNLVSQYGDGHWARAGSLRRLRAQVDSHRIFAVFAGAKIIATFVLAERSPGFLRPNWFAEPHAPALYLTGLAVLPAYQGRGVGRWCLKQAESLSRKETCRALRFDAYDAPAGAFEFYTRCGYVERRRFSFNSVALIALEKTLGRARVPVPA